MSNLEGPHFLFKGWLFKQSRHFKVWRHRFAVLTRTSFFTYANENINDKPTEKVLLKQCHSAHSADTEAGASFAFKLETDDGNFLFFVNSAEERDKWVGILSEFTRQADHRFKVKGVRRLTVSFIRGTQLVTTDRLSPLNGSFTNESFGKVVRLKADRHKAGRDVLEARQSSANKSFSQTVRHKFRRQDNQSPTINSQLNWPFKRQANN